MPPAPKSLTNNEGVAWDRMKRVVEDLRYLHLTNLLGQTMFCPRYGGPAKCPICRTINLYTWLIVRHEAD